MLVGQIYAQGVPGWSGGKEAFAVFLEARGATFSGAVTFSSTVTFSGTIAGNLTVAGGAGGESVFNESSVDADFRIESDANTHGFFLEGSTGNVGIGTAAPAKALEIFDGEFGISKTGVAHGLTGWLPTNMGGRFYSNANTGGLVFMGASDDAGVGGIVYHGVIGVTDPTDTTPAILLSGAKKNTTVPQALGNDETVLQIANYISTPLMTVMGDGDVGIGTTVPNYNLTVAASSSDGITVTGETTPAASDSSVVLHLSSNGGGQVSFIGADGGTANQTISGDSMLFENASSGYIYDNMVTINAPSATSQFLAESGTGGVAISNFSNDNNGLFFDASYYTGNWRSRDAGSNFGFYKFGDALDVVYDTGVAIAGVVTWNIGWTFDSSGNFGIGNDAPLTALAVNGTVSMTPNATSAAGTSVADDAAITVTKGIMRMVGADADALLDTDPAINDGATDGQVVIIQGTADANLVSIADNVNTQLSGGVTMSLGDGDIISLMWDSDYSMWIELYRSDN